MTMPGAGRTGAPGCAKSTPSRLCRQPQKSMVTRQVFGVYVLIRVTVGPPRYNGSHGGNHRRRQSTGRPDQRPATDTRRRPSPAGVVDARSSATPAATSTNTRITSMRNEGADPRYTPGEFAALEIGLATKTNKHKISRTIGIARRLHDETPDAWDAWQAGHIDHDRAARINKALIRLTRDTSKQLLNALVVEVAKHKTVELLGRWLNEFVARSNPTRPTTGCVAHWRTGTSPSAPTSTASASCTPRSPPRTPTPSTRSSTPSPPSPCPVTPAPSNNAAPTPAPNSCSARSATAVTSPGKTTPTTTRRTPRTGTRTSTQGTNPTTTRTGRRRRTRHRRRNRTHSGHRNRIRQQRVSRRRLNCDRFRPRRHRRPLRTRGLRVRRHRNQRHRRQPRRQHRIFRCRRPDVGHRRRLGPPRLRLPPRPPRPRTGPDGHAAPTAAATGGEPSPDPYRTGRPVITPCPHDHQNRPIPATIGVIISAQSLFGFSDTPGQLTDRSTLIPADLIRDLAQTTRHPVLPTHDRRERQPARRHRTRPVPRPENWATPSTFATAPAPPRSAPPPPTNATTTTSSPSPKGPPPPKTYRTTADPSTARKPMPDITTHATATPPPGPPQPAIRTPPPTNHSPSNNGPPKKRNVR